MVLCGMLLLLGPQPRPPEVTVVREPVTAQAPRAVPTIEQMQRELDDCRMRWMAARACCKDGMDRMGEK
jgi:hypothetical protein